MLCYKIRPSWAPDNSINMKKQQEITRTNVDQDLCRNMALLGYNKLNRVGRQVLRSVTYRYRHLLGRLGGNRCQMYGRKTIVCRVWNTCAAVIPLIKLCLGYLLCK